MKAQQALRNAFSLVELSIVLVILGLLVGGVLGGQSLINAAKLRAIHKEYEQFVVAFNTFKEKYNGFPGDLPNATTFWGQQAGNCMSTSGSGTETCNGNGNARIAFWAGSNETLRAWEHLANAGLIAGAYDGYTYNAANLPKSSFKDGIAWNIYANSSFASHTLNLAEISASNAYMTGEDAYTLDSKYDDGKPTTGVLQAYDGTDTPGACVNSGNYILNTGQIGCSILYTYN